MDEIEQINNWYRNRCPEEKYKFVSNTKVNNEQHINMVNDLIGHMDTTDLCDLSKFLCISTFNKNRKQEKALELFYDCKYEHIHSAKLLLDYIEGDNTLNSNIIHIYNYIKPITLAKLCKLNMDTSAKYGRVYFTNGVSPKSNVIGNIIRLAIIHNLSVNNIIESYEN